MLDLTTLSHLRLIPIPRLAQGGRWRVEAMRSLSEPCLLWFTKGQGRIILGGVTRGYAPHDAVFIPPGTMHGFEVGAGVLGTAVFFGRASDVTLPGQPRHLRIRDEDARAEIAATLTAIQRELDSPAPGASRAARHHVGLLGVWLERQIAQEEAEAPRPDAAHRLVARYAALVERDYRSAMGVADYAAALGVTPTHLTRCCKQANGRAAHDLLKDRRLFEARRMLAETRMPVAEIGRSLGFASPAYFSRAFQHLTGQSPSHFRRGG